MTPVQFVPVSFLEKSSFTVLMVSEDEGDTKAKLIDGDYKTFWNSKWWGCTFPCYFSIDLSEKTAMSGVSLAFRDYTPSSGHPGKFNIYVADSWDGSDAATTWTKVLSDGTVELKSGSGVKKGSSLEFTFQFSNVVYGKIIKYEVTEPGKDTDFASMVEFTPLFDN
ncbi:discoidin domain-containing protein [Halosquirtibacter laminarini]|uniref:Discoidin domain-containing protein n=1 Tax=Halosquirtibacter laminarini TaxID=3374600 RepID=A0AC61NGV7_9BACT|nr:discoidin domain-containing protein [Prolixibacteraceae bacterium]